MELGWAVWDFSGFSDGHYTIPFALTGVNGAAASVDTRFTQTPANPIPDLTSLASVELADELTWHFMLENLAEAPAKLLFKDTCMVEMHVISPDGEIVYDARTSNSCSPSGTEKMIDSLPTFTLASETWDYLDSDGCEINDGLHLLVLSQPDHGLVATQPFMHTNSGEGPGCETNDQDAAGVRFFVDDLTVVGADSTTERISFDLTILNTGTHEFDKTNFYYSIG